MRLFNLSPDTQVAGLTCSANGESFLRSHGIDLFVGVLESDSDFGFVREPWHCTTGTSVLRTHFTAYTPVYSCSEGTAEIASNVHYSLGSQWYKVPTLSSTFSVVDDITKTKLLSRQETPPVAPLGLSFFLLGERQSI